jgi:hypothetical protein
MEAFEIKERTKMAVKIYGQEFQIVKPDVKQTRAVLVKINELSEPVEITTAWIDFLDSLGISREVVETMEPEHLMKLIDFVTGVKKN